jgi:signal transduction histidine kinase
VAGGRAAEAPARPRGRPAGWWRRRSVRLRTTALAVAVVGVTLLAGAVALVAMLQEALTDSVERSARQQAEAAAEVVAAGGTPGLLDDDDDDTVAQVLDGDGGVIAASEALVDGDTDGDEGEADPEDAAEAAAARESLAPGLAPGEDETVDLPGDEEEYQAVVAEVPDPPATGRFADARTILVASTLETAEESVGVVVGLLVVGLPVLLLIVAATTWRVVGRALAPVDAIRATAEAVSAADLGRRVPEPAGQDEVARLATTMNRMLERLERAQARQRRFVADASHELRSPLATIRQHSEVARAHPSRTTPDALAGTVLAEGGRLQRLVEDMLLLARADEHGLGLRRRPVDVDDVVLDEARRLRATTELDVDATGVSAGAVDGDADALARVVRNVADNAARHAAGRIALALAERDGTVELVVEDDGPGVPRAERERVFERFVRLDDARARDGGGSGLGLAIVSELVAAHGGTVAIGESRWGGARVAITLPARS